MTEPDETFVPTAPPFMTHFRELKTFRHRIYMLKLWLFCSAIKLKNFLWRKNEQVK
jgi:hypothetical protein